MIHFVPIPGVYIIRLSLSFHKATMRVASFDFGHTNLALVIADVDETSYDVTVQFTKMQDLKSLRCRGCMFEKKDRRTAHLVYHYVESIHEQLLECDLVIGERQPIMGMVDVEQCMLIFILQKYGKCMRLFNPGQMHKAFKMSSDKVERRREIVTITESYLNNFREFRRAREKDHLGDALGFILYFAEHVLPGEQLEEQRRENPFLRFKYDACY